MCRILSNKKQILGGLTIMKMNIINKILAGFLAASTIYAVSGVAFANPKKHLCSLQNIYALKESCESDKSDYESDEEDDEQNSDARSKGQNPISQFVFLINKPFWEEGDQENFFEICSDFSDCDLLKECSLKNKLKVTDILIRYSHFAERQEQVAAILCNFSLYSFFKEYSLDQRTDITDALIECLGQDAAVDDVIAAFSYLAWCNFFKEYSTKQKVKIVKSLTWCLSERECDMDVLRPLRKIFESPEIFEKLDQEEKSLCLKIIERF